MKWAQDELGQLDVDIRKMMYFHRNLHPKLLIKRLHLPRYQAGHELLSSECLQGRVVLREACKVIRCSNPFFCMIQDHESAGIGAFLYKAARRTGDSSSVLCLILRGKIQIVTESEPAQLKAQIKAAETHHFPQLHKDKPMNGLFYRHLHELDLFENLTFASLRSKGLNSGTEGFIIMVWKYGIINTLVYRSRVLCLEVPNTSYRVCHQSPKMLHMLSVRYVRLRRVFDETPLLPYAPVDITSVGATEKFRIYLM